MNGYLLSGLIGAMIGSLVQLGLNVWKLHRDDRTARIDDLCRAINTAADIAKDYWSMAYIDVKDQQAAEATIMAAQALIDGLYGDIRGFLRQTDAHNADQVLASLLDIISGGEFSVSNRPVDGFRHKSVQTAASDMVVTLRRAHRRSLPFEGVVRSYHENRHRTLDMPQDFAQRSSD